MKVESGALERDVERIEVKPKGTDLLTVICVVVIVAAIGHHISERTNTLPPSPTDRVSPSCTQKNVEPNEYYEFSQEGDPIKELIDSFEVYSENDWSELSAERDIKLGVAGLKLGMGRAKVEIILGGPLRNCLGLTHYLEPFYRVCRICGVNGELSREDGCHIHGGTSACTLRFDDSGYLSGVSSLPLEVGDKSLGPGHTVDDFENAFSLKLTRTDEQYNDYELPTGNTVVLYRDGDLVTDASIREPEQESRFSLK